MAALRFWGRFSL